MERPAPTSTPNAQDYRALARSSPWLFRTLHWSVRGVGPDGSDEVTEAWLRRPGHLTVRHRDGVDVVTGAPYASSAPTAAPSSAPRFRPDGLVEGRPEGHHLDHGDPMWQTYLWTAVLDPEELSQHVELTSVHAADRRGRPTWWAQAQALPGYEPRCGCCPLLLGRVSMETEGLADEVVTGDDLADLPTVYLVGLDVRTGVVVDLSPMDGRGGTRVDVDIHAVDVGPEPPRPARAHG